jgi:hypothetical protein
MATTSLLLSSSIEKQKKKSKIKSANFLMDQGL